MEHKEPAFPCPECGTNITLTETLAKPLMETMRAEYETKLYQERLKLKNQSDKISKERAALEQAQSDFESEVTARLENEKAELIKKANEKAEERLKHDISKRQQEVNDLKALILDRDKRLETAQKAELEFMRQTRQLEDQMREKELAMEKELNSRRAEMIKAAEEKANEAAQVQLTERDTKIASMMKQIEDLKKRAEQGSQQLQGEAQEILLEKWLGETFIFDEILPVPKGIRGADVLQKVKLQSGLDAGLVLWEAKRTKTFNKQWLAKLREDQRSCKADIAILVTQTLPENITAFGQMEDIWICLPKDAIALAHSLRSGLIEIAKARAVLVGQESKRDGVYNYLTGAGFRQRVEAIIENFEAMQRDLNQERIAMERIWAKREKQMLGVLSATSGLYGDLQGIAGEEVSAIAALDMPLLNEG